MGRRLRIALFGLGLMLVVAGIIPLLGDRAQAAFVRFPSWGGQALLRAVVALDPATPAPAASEKPIIFGPSEERVRSSPAPIPTVVPTVAPSALPTGRKRRSRLRLEITGNANANVTQASGVNTQGQISNVLGLNTVLERRTDNSAIRLEVPANASLRNTSFGDVSAQLALTRTAFRFGNQPVGAFGQLPIGSIARAYSAELEQRPGRSLQLFSGSAYADDFRIFHILGVRARFPFKTGTAMLGLTTAGATDGSGSRSSALLAGYAVPARGRGIDGSGELAFGTSSAMNAVANGAGLSWQYRLNAGGEDRYVSFTQRRLDASFASVGGGLAQSDFYNAVSYRLNARGFRFNGEAGIESLGESNVIAGSYQERQSLSVAHGVGRGTLTLQLANSRSASSYDLGSLSTVSEQYAFGLRRSRLSETIGLQRSTSATSGSNAQVRYDTSIYTDHSPKLSSLFEITRTRALGLFPLQTDQLQANVLRRGKLFDIGLNDVYTVNTATNVGVTQNALTLTLSRRLNNATSIQAQYGILSSRDRYSALGNGTNSTFNISIGAPFTLNNGRLTGRADSRLPATIRGIVTTVDGSAFGTGFIGSGFGGITVLLDGTEPVRTDALGNFEFSYVSPGRHDVSIDPASLPRGVTADFPFYSVDVGGGQTANVTLAVGNGAAIEGRVFGFGRAGEKYGVPHVAIQLDGRQRTETGPTGTFGFGRVADGEHTVELVNATLPADFGLAEPVRRVSVHSGAVTVVDFSGAPLGSISGRIFVKQAFGAVPEGGILNAYVVANPGDHAAISNDDGYFVMDNLPPGTYVIGVDGETLPDGADPGPTREIVLHPGEKFEGAVFEIGEKAKDIVFTFKGNENVSTAQLVIARKAIAPLGATSVNVSTTSRAKSVIVSAFNTSTPLVSKDGQHWSGTIAAPAGTAAGMYSVVAKINAEKTIEERGDVRVDPGIPLYVFEMQPVRATVGQYVSVTARFNADVREGDRIVWRDGVVTRLGKPITGRIFTYSVKLSSLPYDGIMRGDRVSFPVSLGVH